MLMRPRPGVRSVCGLKVGSWLPGTDQLGSCIGSDRAALQVITGRLQEGLGRRATLTQLPAASSRLHLVSLPEPEMGESPANQCQSPSHCFPPFTFPPLTPLLQRCLKNLPLMDLGHPTLPLWGEEEILETSSAKPKYVLGKVSASPGQESETLKGPNILFPPLSGLKFPRG